MRQVTKTTKRIRLCAACSHRCVSRCGACKRYLCPGCMNPERRCARCAPPAPGHAVAPAGWVVGPGQVILNVDAQERSLGAEVLRLSMMHRHGHIATRFYAALLLELGAQQRGPQALETDELARWALWTETKRAWELVNFEPEVWINRVWLALRMHHDPSLRLD